MKCPKCGYNSFECYDRCNKCSEDLTGYKQTYNIASLVLPYETREKLASGYHSAQSETERTSDTTEAHDDIFSFNLPDDSPIESEQQNVDPFNFDEPVTSLNQTNNVKNEDDVFADLLESTSQADESPFTASHAAAAPVAPKVTESSSGPGEFDLDSFSWDDTSDETAAAGSKEDDYNFDSLFGDTQGNTKK
ncbi:MAG: hypothetical protein PHR66_06505 [Desulfuromonadaceae bacterium]|nr:hypothetical protein [Desulfuromonadaceae bacterium]